MKATLAQARDAAVATFRQTRVLALVLVRHLTRRALRAGGVEATQGRVRVPWFLLLTLAWVGGIAQLLWTRFDHAAHAPSGGTEAMTWQLLGALLTLAGYGLVELAPEHGTLRPPLRIALLDELPVTTGARLMLVWFRNPFVPALAIWAALAWSPPSRDALPDALLVALLGLLVFVAMTTVGYALATWTRVLTHARGRRWIAIFALTLVMVGLQPILFADLLGAATGLGGALDALAHALRDGSDLGTVTAFFAGLWVLALLAIALAERRGYDRLDAPRAGRVSTTNARLDLARAERVLMHREGANALVFLGWTFCIVIAGLAVLAFIRPPPPAIGPRFGGMLGLGYAIAVAYTGAVVALSRAGAAVRRDAGVRAFLAPLPIAPFDTLVGKVRALRWILLPVFVSGIPAVVVAIHLGSFELAWRTLVALAVVWLGADAAVSVAFLTGGVGVPGVRTLGAPTSLAVQLLMLPLVAAAGASELVPALAGIVAVWAIAREARRAAARAIRWIDDAADDLERDTTVWRALLGLGMFFATRALGGRILGLGDVVDPAVQQLVVDALAATVLVLVTVLGPPKPARHWWHYPGPAAATPWLQAACGVLAGLALALLLLAVSSLVGPGLLGPGGPGGPAGPSAPVSPVPSILAVLAGLVAVVLVPLAETLFFAGWLQAAIAGELPPRRRAWAFVLAGAAHALAHLGAGGTPLIPTLAVGLTTSALFAWTGRLAPAALAHVAYAAVLALA